MNAETIKVQVEISKTLAEALSLAAKKDRRSRPSFIIKTLEETPAVKAALKTTIQRP
jgi:predicted HicB family RNase H-like nuclease